MTDEPLVSTRDKPGEYDALETAKPDEPLFILQGGDPLAPTTVLHWVELCRESGRAEQDPEKAARILRKATDAELVAWAMQAYQRGEEAKDSEGRRARYNDASPAVDTDTARLNRRTLIQAVATLRNAAALANDVVDELSALGLYPPERDALSSTVESINAVSSAIEPRRGMERT